MDISQHASESETRWETACSAWKSAIGMRDLFWGALSGKTLKCGVELYSPSYVSRQLGYYQAIPAPVPESSNRYSSSRAVFSNKDDIEQNNKAFVYNMSFPMKTRVATSKSSSQFREWWAKRVGSRFKDGLVSARQSAFAGNPWAQEKPKAVRRGKITSKVARAIPTINESTTKKAVMFVFSPTVTSRGRIPLGLLLPPEKLLTVMSEGSKSDSVLRNFFMTAVGNTLTAAPLSTKTFVIGYPSM
ncbi:hypothetical protein RchiOBHm_Chr4g0419231 [Rosa chinensis]|uniref:Uncharacterized protein n=2 Tax=Rosa chinensis TaxID=74649 RepID=A0A2P6QXM5_ROSCH|nr:hypothetical protein RchiOBHm_Chr4g0419231 [Rosa chinensis]